ncbi:MAG: hypothetical protein Ta2B_27000 [Termitinemataceae bacterium]|nr:MAG: hypothetical protein Ta2B_27000 [Termitinemataceae bacterium]
MIISSTVDVPQQEQPLQTILLYQNEETYASMPQWVKNYLLGGEDEIEKEITYNNYYCFVAEESASTLSALMQWQRNFNIEQDLSLLVFMRVYDRLKSGTERNPGYVYGNFFEEILTLTSSTTWEKSEQRESFWVKLRNEKTKEETYKLMILCVVDKKIFTTQLTRLMSGIDISKKEYTREQINAVNRVRSTFWNTF